MHLATLHSTHRPVSGLNIYFCHNRLIIFVTLGLSVGGPPCDRRGFSDEPEPFSNCRAIFLGSFDLTWIFESWASWSTTHLISFKKVEVEKFKDCWRLLENIKYLHFSQILTFSYALTFSLPSHFCFHLFLAKKKKSKTFVILRYSPKYIRSMSMFEQISFKTLMIR